MSSTQSQVRQHVFYSGNVQGVGFRYTAARIAQHYAVVGFVRNLPDRRVELVAQGAADQVDQFLAEIANTMSGYIRQADAKNESPAGDYQSFEIAH
jgi:acylphosphatase